MKKSFVRLFTLVMLSLFAVSCGSSISNVLTGVSVQSQTKDNELWMSFSANLNLGNMQFASISVPVIHPHGQTPVGQVDLVSGLGGVNQIKISVNLTELADVRTAIAQLPNGNMVPLLANNEVISVNLGRGAKLYLALSETVTAIGVAVPISAFDSIGSKLPGLNIFPVVTVNNVVGTAGIFTGANAGQNGIAVVADVSKIVKLGDLMPSNTSLIQAEQARTGIKLNYSSQAGSKSQKERLDSMIYELHKKRTILRMR